MTGAEASLPEPLDSPVRIVEVAGTRVGVCDDGDPADPAPFLFVPGVPGGARDFRYLAPLLAPQRRAIRLEIPGFASVRDARWDDYSPTGRAGLLGQVADALQLERFILVGHSMAGPAVAHLTANAPDRVIAAGLLASVGLRRHRGMFLPVRGMRWLRRATRVPLLNRALLARYRAGFAKLGFPGADSLTLADIRTQLAHFVGLDFDAIAQTAARITRPTLVAWAGDDPIIQDSVSTALAAAISGAQAVRFERGGHNIQKTQCRPLSKALLALSVA